MVPWVRARAAGKAVMPPSPLDIFSGRGPPLRALLGPGSLRPALRGPLAESRLCVRPAVIARYGRASVRLSGRSSRPARRPPPPVPALGGAAQSAHPSGATPIQRSCSQKAKTAHRPSPKATVTAVRARAPAG